MATIVNIHEAKTHFSKLLERVQQGEEIIIAKAGEPIAQLKALPKRKGRRPGSAKGLITVPDSFFDPLPDDVMRYFEEWDK
jgi:antitoxin (DNA-binding transcriptional repressor) of toxin-antitoxin stability system